MTDTKKAAALLATDATAERDERCTLQTHFTTQEAECQIRTLRQAMKNENITPKQVVQEVKPVYPGFDKTLLSKCLNAEKYGVTMTGGSFSCLAEAFPQLVCESEKQPRRGDGHKLRDRVTCRLEKSEFELLQRLIHEDGFDTMQAWLAYMIRQYIKQKGAER